MQKEIEREIVEAQKDIWDLKKNSIDSIRSISQEITSNIIEKMSGDKLNESSIKATVEDVANTYSPLDSLASIVKFEAVDPLTR